MDTNIISGTENDDRGFAGNGSDISDSINSFIASGTGTGTGGSDYTGTGTGEIPRRGRGRPRKEGNVNILGDSEPATPKSRTRGKAGIAAQDLAQNISLLTKMITGITSHDWWERTPSECMPLADPLKAYIDTMSPEAVAVAQKAVLPISIVVGAIVVFAEPVNKEIEFAKYVKRERLGTAVLRQKAPSGNGQYPSQNGTGTEGNTVHAGSGKGNGDWRDKLPSVSD